MNRLHHYLRRIGYSGPVAPSLVALRALHSAHLLNISYENLDVQLERPVGLEIDPIFEKIVENRRGGWCYEMNGLFAWALREIGFDVRLLGTGVERRKHGEQADMTHLALLVQCEGRSFVADVGFGNAFLFPIPLVPGEHSDTRFAFRLEQLGEWWRFHNHPGAGDTYDFTERGYHLDDFAQKNLWLQRSPESPFVQSLVCHRFTEEGVTTLRGAVLRIYTKSEMLEQIAPNARDLDAMLRKHFQLEEPKIDELWERVRERHKTWLRKTLRGF